MGSTVAFGHINTTIRLHYCKMKGETKKQWVTLTGAVAIFEQKLRLGTNVSTFAKNTNHGHH